MHVLSLIVTKINKSLMLPFVKKNTFCDIYLTSQHR